MKRYTIKPLVLVQDTFPKGKHIDMVQRWTAQTAIGELILTETRDGFKKHWTFHIVGSMPQRLKGAKDIESAKAAAEAAYRERLEAALDPVED